MALEESIDGLTKLESNKIVAYVEPQLRDYLEQNGKVTVDYRENSFGGGGYLLTVGESNCDTGACGGGCS